MRLQSRTSESETYIGSQTVPSIPPSPLPNYLKPQKRCKSEGNIGLAFFNETPNSSEDENQATIVSLPPGMGNSAGMLYVIIHCIFIAL